MTHSGKKITFGTVCGFRAFLCLPDFFLCFPASRDLTRNHYHALFSANPDSQGIEPALKPFFPALRQKRIFNDLHCFFRNASAYTRQNKVCCVSGQNFVHQTAFQLAGGSIQKGFIRRHDFHVTAFFIQNKEFVRQNIQDCLEMRTAFPERVLCPPAFSNFLTEQGIALFKFPVHIPQIQMNADTGKHFLPVKGFGDEIHTACGKSPDFIKGILQGTDKNHRHCTGQRIRLQCFTDLITVHLWHTDIQQNQIRRIPSGITDRKCPVRSRFYNISLSHENCAQQMQIGRGIIHCQHCCLMGSCGNAVHLFLLCQLPFVRFGYLCELRVRFR